MHYQDLLVNTLFCTQMQKDCTKLQPRPLNKVVYKQRGCELIGCHAGMYIFPKTYPTVLSDTKCSLCYANKIFFFTSRTRVRAVYKLPFQQEFLVPDANCLTEGSWSVIVSVEDPGGIHCSTQCVYQTCFWCYLVGTIH